MKNKTAGIFAAGTLPLLLAFGNVSAAGETEIIIIDNTITEADICVDEKASTIIKQKLDEGAEFYTVQGGELEDIKAACMKQFGKLSFNAQIEGVTGTRMYKQPAP